jgi:HSP20 family protein
VNVIESSKKFKIEVAAPGMCKDDLKIELTADNQLMLSLEKREEHTDDKEPKSCETGEECHYLRREFSCNYFRQLFNIPESVDKEHISAKMKHGVLCITLPKRDGADKGSEARQIAIE